MGGKHDSSKTRAAPFFDALLSRFEEPNDWVPKLLSLPRYGSGAPVPASCGGLEEYKWGGPEKALHPPKSLLRHLIQNLSAPTRPDGSSAWPQRQKLIRRDPETLRQALELVELPGRSRAWFLLEGASYPDAYFRTRDMVVVVEGKRMESGPTTSTKWMSTRHQMLRHLDGALDLAGDRALFGFFMVEGYEGDAVPKEWERWSSETISDETLRDSLPHRDDEKRRQIREAFLGVTTWQAACRTLGVPFDSLPDEVQK